ncbi:MAG: Uma2 family endonuclease [Caldilineaceae bacterium]
MVVAVKEETVLKRAKKHRHLIEAEWPLHHFTVEEYHRIGEIELFQTEGHVELLGGLIIWNTDRTDMDQVQKATFLYTELPLRRFSLTEYQELIAAGLLAEDEQLELIDGLILEMSPINPKHAACLDALSEILTIKLYKQAKIRVQSPIALELHSSQPQPDLTIAKLRPDGYWQQHPRENEILLILEVSDSTLEKDRDEKLDLYAQASVPEYWIANLVDEQIEVYRDPMLSATGKAIYKTKITYMHGQTLAPLKFPECVIAVDEVMPKAKN